MNSQVRIERDVGESLQRIGILEKRSVKEAVETLADGWSAISEPVSVVVDSHTVVTIFREVCVVAV